MRVLKFGRGQWSLTRFRSFGVGAKSHVVTRDKQGTKCLFLSLVLGACSPHIPATSPDLPTENSAVSAMLRSCACMLGTGPCADRAAGKRSEAHTSELQSLMRISYAVFCMKKQTQT